MTNTTEAPKPFNPEDAEVLEGEYRGNAMLIIRQSPQDKFPFQFGLKKARLILAHIETIRAFVEKNSH